MTSLVATSLNHWPDHCRHDRPLDRFLGSFMDSEKTYDVHVYQDNALDAVEPDMHVCIRYGAEDSQYLSPGNAREFVRRFTGKVDVPEDYRHALPLVEEWLRGGER